MMDQNVPRLFAPKAKIMIVDDDRMNLEFFKNLLRDTNAMVTAVESGRECISHLAEGFDLILLDHMMPEMDGIETLKEIREINSEIPVIALTANAANNGKEFYVGLGFNDYLPKPVEGAVLEDTIRKFLPAEFVETKADSSAGAGDLGMGCDISEIEGISLSDGLLYCGSRAALDKFLNTFYNKIEIKAAEIEDAYNKGDLSSFTIKVHALKSTSRIIGAKELSEFAESLEKAGSEGNQAYIDANAGKLLEMYRSYRGRLSGYIEGSHKA